MAGPAYPLRLPMRLPLLWRMAVLSITAGVVSARLWAWSQGEAFGRLPTHIVPLVALPWVAVMYGLMQARAGEAGLRLFDGWGIWRRVAWDEVVEVGLARWPAMLFAPALAIRTRDGRRHWLARDSGGLAALHALALRHGGPAHPLVRALETPLHRL
jgi:hypothetical protein